MLDTNALFKSIFLLEDPRPWSCRYSNRPTLATPLFVEIGRGENEGKGRLIDIQGGVDPDWTPLEKLDIDPNSVLGDPGEPIMKKVKEHLEQGDHAKALVHLATGLSIYSDPWAELVDDIEKTRYRASTWFERDIRQVGLVDELTDETIACLEGEDLDSAVEMGLIRAPRHPRPSEEDWLATLLEYATDQGYIKSPEEIRTSILVRTPLDARRGPARQRA